MDGANAFYSPQPLGHSTEFSHFVLDSSEILEDVILRLQGKIRLRNKEGDWDTIKVGEDRYNVQCIAWMKGKLQELLNKNMYLSQLNNDEMYREAQFMSISFLTELYYNSREFFNPKEGNAVELYTELGNLYLNFLSQAIRRPLFASDKEFLRNTTSETTQKVHQTLEEQQKKEGIMGLFRK